ncbi:MAG: LPS export ABC transporter periplasmic protein LptC [Litoreibacter sp.]|nr:LPS export ABC transporter periplasmic protein LptC [Litoreibacter sp.]
MPRPDNLYSRFVQIAKVAFPILALVFLSTLFLFSRNVDLDAAIPFADIDIESITREQRLISPEFSGVTTDGSAVVLHADSAAPDPENSRNFSALVVLANIATQSGTTYDIHAERAYFDGRSERLDLDGNVRLQTSTGYRLETQSLVTSVAQTMINAPGPVSGTGPGGKLEAGAMDLKADGDTHVLVFKNRVKLIYQPRG